MKKIILSSLFVLAVSFTYAQKAEFGIKGGLNSSDFNGDTDGVDLKSRIGFNVGAFVSIQLAEKIILQPEILYSTQGAKAENVTAPIDDMLFTGDIKFNLSYINVPVMIKYYVSDKFNFEAGPQIGFLTSAKTSTKLDGFDQTFEEDVKDSFESVDFGLNLGAGYDFSKKFSAGIRYNFGLSNVAKTESGDTDEINNSVFSLSVGYKF